MLSNANMGGMEEMSVFYGHCLKSDDATTYKDYVTTGLQWDDGTGDGGDSPGSRRGVNRERSERLARTTVEVRCCDAQLMSPPAAAVPAMGLRQAPASCSRPATNPRAGASSTTAGAASATAAGAGAPTAALLRRARWRRP